VTAKVVDGAVELQGPKGSCARRTRPASCSRSRTATWSPSSRPRIPQLGKFHGLARSLVANAVAGVTDGFKRELDIVGVGYRAESRASR
jgi:Ribosomal protein L6P/L9E